MHAAQGLGATECICVVYVHLVKDWSSCLIEAIDETAPWKLHVPDIKISPWYTLELMGMKEELIQLEQVCGKLVLKLQEQLMGRL